MHKNFLMISGIFILFSILFEVMIFNLVFAQGWERVFEGVVNGDTLPAAYSGGNEFSTPTFVDIDSDGDSDLFVGGAEGKIRFYRNVGTSSSPKWTFISDSYAYSIYASSVGSLTYSAPTFADIDGDGDFDLFIGESNLGGAGDVTAYVRYLRNDGSQFEPSWTLVTSTYRVYLDTLVSPGFWKSFGNIPLFGDVDRDGDLDLFLGGQQLDFYRNEGNASSPIWRYVTKIDSGVYLHPALIDEDADGNLDILLGNLDGRISLYRHTGSLDDPHWKIETGFYDSLDVGAYCAPALVDIDGDGDLDLFLGEWTGNVNFYVNKGDTANPKWVFQQENMFSIDVGQYSSPAFVDIDGDGDKDMFIGEYNWWANGGAKINFYRNDGNPLYPSWTFVTDFYNSITGKGRISPTFIDIDADRDFDMFVWEGKSKSIYYYQNDGDLHFPLWHLSTPNYQSIQGEGPPAFVDIDADGDYDLFTGGVGKINFYRNDGDSSLAVFNFVTNDYGSIEIAGSSSAPEFADFDRDGDYDLFVGDTRGKVHYYRNDGTAASASWTFVTDSIDIGECSIPRLVDIDADGDMDLFIGEFNGGINFYRNLLYTNVEDDEYNTPVEGFSLFQNYPNPFNLGTVIKYELPTEEEVTIAIYNVLGQTVRSFSEGKKSAGVHRVYWDGKGNLGNELPTGIYICQIKIGIHKQSIKMVFLR